MNHYKLNENNNRLYRCLNVLNRGVWDDFFNKRVLILGFTGVDQVYEKPDSPELVLKTIHLSIEESTMQVVQMLEENVSSMIKKNTLKIYCELNFFFFFF